jgi:hypothetical protein
MEALAVQYEYRPEEKLGNDEHIGFTAQQIASISSKIPGYNMITYDADGHPHAVKYNETPALFAAALQYGFQHQKEDIEKLKARIETLEAR